MNKRTVVVLVFLLTIILTAVPTLAGWGAGWGSGSAIGSGQVDGLQKIKGKSATVNGYVAQPGCTLPSIHKDDEEDDHKSSKPKSYTSSYNDPSKDCTNSKQTSPSTNPSQVVPGVVWCSKVGSNKIVHGNQRVNLPINFSGATTIHVDNDGKATFEVHVSVNQVTLNMVLNAQQLCPQKHSKDDDKKSSSKDAKSSNKTGGKGDDKNDDDNAQWLIVDFVPQSFSGALQAVYQGKVLTQAIYDCSMPWATLEGLQYQQRLSYTCPVVRSQ